MKDFADWLLTLIKQLFKDVAEFLGDVFIKVLELALEGIAAVIEAIPVPEFMQNGLQPVFAALSSDVWFFLTHLKLSELFTVLAAAVAFRLARKFLTLFQW